LCVIYNPGSSQSAQCTGERPPPGRWVSRAWPDRRREAWHLTPRSAHPEDRPLAAFAAAASQAASSRNASVVSAHTAEEIICVVCVAAPDRPAAIVVGLAERRRRSQGWGSGPVTQPVSGRCPLSCGGS